MEIDINNLHHAYLILGNENSTKAYIGTFFERLKMKPLGNPDIIFWKEDKFGIDEARVLKNRVETKAFGDRKIFVITSPQITPEAQNALLKVFEEPTPNTHFFILAKRNYLLPTLLSRLYVINLLSEVVVTTTAKDFLKLDVSGRLAFIRNTTADENFTLPDFIEELLFVIKEKDGVSKELKKVFELSKFANDPAANSRMILEHLALTLPNSIE
jgi:DNA polymerase III, gamma/tau subunits